MEKRVMMLVVGLLVVAGLPAVGFCQEESAFVIEAAPEDTGPPFLEEVYAEIDAIAFFESCDGGICYADGNVGIGTTLPNARLDVEVDSGGAATIGSSGNSAIGNWAVAMGYGTDASGSASTATGFYTEASGGGSTAMGFRTTASENCSTAMGYDTEARGGSSTAMGYGTEAIGECSTAIGCETIASGYVSTAMGRSIEAAGNYSFAIGLDSTYYLVGQSSTMAIMGGKVGIGKTAPIYPLDIQGTVRASGYVAGDIVFQKDEVPLWRMFEDEDGLYVESIKTGKIYTFVLQEVEGK